MYSVGQADHGGRGGGTGSKGGKLSFRVILKSRVPVFTYVLMQSVN